MVEFNKYIVLNADFSNRYGVEYTDLKYDVISSFISSQIEDSKCSLFEMKPTKNSIIYDITSSYKEAKINSKNCLFTNSINLSKTDIRNIVGEEDFYLGHLLIIISELNEEKVIDLVNLWGDDLLKTGLEFFKMDSDGLSFYWYNPTDSLAENDFKNMINIFERNFTDLSSKRIV
ncbi:hypothetical protein MRP92_02995 [Flavobacterium covae]|uniref:hypothetical protein n=1 Tax=Flavobacterium covae TaxID=2906076 RepID=UPI001FB71E2D|nr:hypothetical protein [Flavobacterium covae]MCJ1805876.1 hypothetical protein [Flavobacterium covae]